MAKAKAKARKRIPVKKVKLPVKGVLHVEVPDGHVPVVATHESHIEIAPVKKEQSWLDYLFGTEKK